MNHKNFKDYPQLIKTLKDRKLIITDENQAIEFLKKTHYYRLSAYFIPFQYPKNSAQKDIFKDNTTFEDIQKLYCFDSELRELFFFYISHFEIILRAQLSHIHAKKYNSFGYIQDSRSLKRELRIKDIFLFYEFISQVNKEKRRSSEKFVEHFKKKYSIDDLPLWALVEILSFGAMSKFFKLMQLQEQLEFLEFLEMKNIKVNVFENWLETLAYVRNICAHHARLWNKNLTKKFKKDVNYPFLNPSVQKDKVFFALSVLAEILKDSSIKTRFKDLLAKYPTIPTNSMGIPQDWETLTPWNNL